MNLSIDRNNRIRIPNIAAGFVVGALLAGAIVPLLGDSTSTQVSTTTPDIFGGTGPVADATTPRGDAETATASNTETAAPNAEEGAQSQGRDASDNPGIAPADEEPTAPLSATDVGVTAEAIKLGVMVPKCPMCGAIGFDISDNYADIARAFATDLNDRGGINGRRIELVIATTDPVADAVNGGSSDRQACLQLTEGEKVFAALITIATSATHTECYYEEHETFTIAQATDQEFRDPDSFNANNGRLFVIDPTSARMLASWADHLTSSGSLEGRTIGVVADDTTAFATRSYLIPALESGGVTPARVAILPDDRASRSTATSTAQADMRSAGVDTVLFVVNGVVQQSWIQQAESSGWRPQYHLSDYPCCANDFFASPQPDSFTGALAYSSWPVLGAARTPFDQRCYDVWERASGGKTDASDIKTASVTTVCNLFHLFEQGARSAGPKLDRVSIAQAMAQLGDIDLGGAVGGKGSLGGPYGFGQVKFSAVDVVGVKRWDGDKYVPVSQPFRMTR